MTNSKEQLEKHQLNQFELWETLKSFYKEKFGIAPELVDIVSVIDLLKLCAAGADNKSIASFLNETEMGVAQTIDAYLGFMGWEYNLSFSPMRLYKELNKPDVETFINEVIIRYGYKLNEDITKMYESACIVDKLERLLDEEWV